MDIEEFTPIVQILRGMATDRRDVPAMLHLLLQRLGPDRAVGAAGCFALAFESNIGITKRIRGWVCYGGSLTDREMSEYLTPIIDKWLLKQT